jgi:hypothetical protein
MYCWDSDASMNCRAYEVGTTMEKDAYDDHDSLKAIMRYAYDLYSK